MVLINYNDNANKTGVYCIKNQINNKTYIGSTKNSFEQGKTDNLLLLKNITNTYKMHGIITGKKILVLKYYLFVHQKNVKNMKVIL